jgi:hypothetical protein
MELHPIPQPDRRLRHPARALLARAADIVRGDLLLAMEQARCSTQRVCGCVVRNRNKDGAVPSVSVAVLSGTGLWARTQQICSGLVCGETSRRTVVGAPLTLACAAEK